MSKSGEYFENVMSILSEISHLPEIRTCAELFAETLKNEKNIYLFGTGHSHMLAEEMFYRAGGLVNIRPILETSLMLHESASKSTEIERLSGYAEIIFEHYGVSAGDTMVIISNSGRNSVCVDMALLCKSRGVNVVALTSVTHSMSGESRHKSGKRLFEVADIVIDNHGCYGDSCVKIDEIGKTVSPTSTVVGAAILNAIEAECVDILVKQGIEPEVFSSSNVDGGDEINGRYIKKYNGVIKHL